MLTQVQCAGVRHGDHEQRPGRGEQGPAGKVDYKYLMIIIIIYNNIYYYLSIYLSIIIYIIHINRYAVDSDQSPGIYLNGPATKQPGHGLMARLAEVRI